MASTEGAGAGGRWLETEGARGSVRGRVWAGGGVWWKERGRPLRSGAG